MRTLHQSVQVAQIKVCTPDARRRLFKLGQQGLSQETEV